MPDKPRVLCTRRMPPNVEARLARDYDAALNPEDRLYSEDDLVKGSEGRDGIFCAGGDPMTRRSHRPASRKRPRHRHVLGRLRARRGGCSESARHRRDQYP